MASVAKRKWTKPDGSIGEKWVVRYKDGAAHPQRTFTLKKDADAFRRQVEREIEEGNHVTRRNSRTVAQLLDEFLDHLHSRAIGGQITAAHVEAQRRALRYARQDLGHRLLCELTWQEVESHGKKLRTRSSDVFKRPLSTGTIAYAMSGLNRAISWGVRRGYAARNVVPDAMKELGPSPMIRIETFSRDEMRQVIAAIENRPPTIAYRSQALMRAVVYLGAMCGLRRGEIFGLRWEAIDFANGLVHVQNSLTKYGTLKGPKTKAGLRSVPLPRMVAAAMEAWRPYVVADDRGLIFRTKSGGAITDNAFYSTFWHPLLRRAGLPGDGSSHRHFHATRHFAGSAWLDAGVPLPEVSRFLGHANPAITARTYSHVIGDVHQRASLLDQCASNLGGFEPKPATHVLRIAA